MPSDIRSIAVAVSRKTERIELKKNPVNRSLPFFHLFHDSERNMVASGVPTRPVNITTRQRENTDRFPTGTYGNIPDSCSHDSMSIEAIKRTGIVRNGPSHFRCSTVFRLIQSWKVLFDKVSLSFMLPCGNITASQIDWIR